MKKISMTSAAALWLAAYATCPKWPEEVYLLRHAEIQDSSTDSPAGLAARRGLA